MRLFKFSFGFGFGLGFGLGSTGSTGAIGFVLLLVLLLFGVVGSTGGTGVTGLIKSIKLLRHNSLIPKYHVRVPSIIQETQRRLYRRTIMLSPVNILTLICVRVYPL